MAIDCLGCDAPKLKNFAFVDYCGIRDDFFARFESV